MSRPAVQVLPRHELESRPRLFLALERALGLTFTADPEPGIVALLVLGDPDLSMAPALPTLRLVHPEPPPGDVAQIRLGASERLDLALRRQELSDGYGVVTNGLSPTGSAQVLASLGRRALWTHDASIDEGHAMLVPRELAAGETLRNRLRPGVILPLLPLVSFLVRVAEDSGLKRAPLRAAFLIDDPNLHRPRYGYLDFAELAARSKAEGWHIAFATIPLDAWFVDKRVARLFLEPDSSMSLLIHGNRHVKCELARLTDDDQALRELSQALRRIRRLESRTGLNVSRVVAPPHGFYSATAARALARLGYGALCISNPYPWLQPDAPREALAGWRPAEYVEGLPIIPRHHIAGDREELVLRAFLRQPLVVYGHHTDAARGLDVFSDLASRINALGDVSWMDLDRIARTNAEIVVSSDATVVRPYAADATVELDRPTTVLVEMDDLHLLDVEITGHGQVYSGIGPHAIKSSGTLRVSARRADRVDPDTIAPPRANPWPWTRRILTESRDRLMPLMRQP